MTLACWIRPDGRCREVSFHLLPTVADPAIGMLRARSTCQTEQGEVGLSVGAAETTVRLDLHRVTDEAFDEALSRLEGDTRPAVLVYRCHGAWAAEAVGGGRAAADRLSVLRSIASLPRLPAYEMPMGFRDLQAEGAHRLLRLGLDCWQRSGGIYSEDHEAFRWVLPRSQFALPVEGGGAPDIIYLGPMSTSAAVWGRRWATKLAPRSRALPDPRFQSRVVSIYDRVHDAGEPSLHRVLAVVRKADGECAWVPYDRVVLPYKLASGRPLFHTVTRFAHGSMADLLAAAA